MSVSIEQLGVSVTGNVTRRRDDSADRTTFVINEAQANELYNALGPVLDFFNSQKPNPKTIETTTAWVAGEVVAISSAGAGGGGGVGGVGAVAVPHPKTPK